ncbi:hypothetical protein [Ascidiimonas sp. W6]|uniref:hypothetical protein n=1 Tax=Ascidiimonas meishanensis TaxID=3128903 RepID=UPI0030ED863D
MKKIFCALFILTSFLGFSQEDIPEAEFVGEAFVIQPDNSIVKLKKETVKIRTRTGVSVYLTGVGKTKTKISTDGCCSEVVIKPKDEIKIVVKAANNDNDPISAIQIFKLTQKKNKRVAELASFGTFSGNDNNKLDYLKFNGEKYGENSYLLTIKEFERGAEYGIMLAVTNVYVQTSNTVISTFAVE